MAFRYQSTLKCGTDGGLRLNEPDMEKCGIFMCGRLHSKLKIPFSQSTTPETNERIFSNAVVNADLMPSRMLDAVDRIDSRPEEMSDCRVLMTDVIDVRIEFQAEDAACCTAAKTVAVVVCTFVQAVETAELMAFTTVSTADFTASQPADVAVLTVCHAAAVADWIDDHAELTAEPIAERIVLTVS